MALTVASALASLVADVCEMDGSIAVCADLEHRLEVLINQLEASLASSPGAATIAALDRDMQAGAMQLSGLGPRLAAVVRSGEFGSAATERIQAQLHLACELAEQLVNLAIDHGMGAAAQALLGCTSLPLECGRDLMAIPDASSSGHAGLAVASLSSQARLLTDVALIPGNPAPLAPPEPLLAWLSAAASRVLALNGTSLGRGCAREVQLSLGRMAYLILCHPLFSPHVAALQLDASLQDSLVQLLVPPLHATAAAMQLPADRRPAELDWMLVHCFTYALMIQPLCHTFLSQAVANKGDSRYVPCLLQTAAQLLAAAPASRPDSFKGDADFSRLWASLLSLLGVACSGRRPEPQQQGRSALPDASRQQLAWQMLQALLRMPVALRMTAEFARLQADHAEVARDRLGLFLGILSEFHRLASSGPEEMADRQVTAVPPPDYSIVDSLADVPACCAAASAMVRALPHVAVLEELAQLQPSPEAGAAVYSRGQLGLELMLPISGLASAIHRYCQGMGVLCSAADATAALQALWQLHTTLCRGIHASTAGLSVAQPHSMALLVALGCCWNAVLSVQEALQGRAVNSDADISDGKLKHLLAMSVAQAEAVVVAAAFQPPLTDEALASLLHLAVKHGPEALASSPPVQQALDDIVAGLGAGQASQSADHHFDLPADLQQYQQQRREPQPHDALQLAQAAIVRSCAYLRCANVAGGPAARQGSGSQRCSKCRVAWYCGTACSHADWRAGHRRVCRALGAARVSEREAVVRDLSEVQAAV
ncbi:hypothetical protein D9Q98_007193 [Chlorella vulgaris]|uniref:MYND-type domain-containing protein n=1 Tax=Chlorella vulgaris TaxID=3077 RepID=A0A9D4TJL2_CHLVU|nr:hypothetical protein D9Q98_007193 [Chlorella vulgaris]